MTELFGHHLDVDSDLKGDRGGTVAQVVQPHGWKVAALDESAEAPWIQGQAADTELRWATMTSLLLATLVGDSDEPELIPEEFV